MRFLESELDDKESLLVSVQRLKDEARGMACLISSVFVCCWLTNRDMKQPKLMSIESLT